jgi:hypothetical protein
VVHDPRSDAVVPFAQVNTRSETVGRVAVADRSTPVPAEQNGDEAVNVPSWSHFANAT